MRVLKRDMPLSILVDILVQIVFVLSVVFALEILVGSESSGFVDPKHLQAEIDRLKRELAALKEENERLGSALGDAQDRLGDFVRAGERDCFRPRKEVVLIRWIDSKTVRVEKGEEFESLEAAIAASSSLLKTISIAEIQDHFGVVRQYSVLNKCLMSVRFQYPDATPKEQWLPAWRSLYTVFRRGFFEPV